MLRLVDPIWLNALWLLPFVVMVVWFSAVVQTRFRRVLCAVLRTLIVAAVIFALTRPISEMVEEHDSPPVIVALADVSASVPGDDKSAGETWTVLRTKLHEGVYCEEVDFADTVSPRDQPATLDTSETNIESALDWAVERLGNNRNGHVVLFSDGRATQGDALAAAARAAQTGVRIHTIPLGARVASAPRIVEAVPPEDARIGVTGQALIRIQSGQPQVVQLSLVDSNGIDAARILRRVEGDSFVALPLTPTRKGLHYWTAVLETGVGRQQHSDAVELGFEVSGPPALLLVDPEPLSLEPLQQVLRRLSFEHHVILPASFPTDQELLWAYDAVVLSDCESPMLGDEQEQLLQEFVEHGGGLIFIGGRCVSTKQWHDSRLERLLPIDFIPVPVQQQQRLKPVHVCYVLDVSGSMEQTLGADQNGPVSKFAMMKTAVAASLDALPPTAVVTIIVFSIHHRVVLEAVPIEQIDEIKQAVKRIGVGGGTNMVPALVDAVQILNRTEIAKHMILLTDGISSEDPPPDLIDWLSASRISLTAVAVGADSNTVLMQLLARETQGVYHFCGDATRIPRVFVREAENIKTLAAIEQPPIQPRLGPQPADFIDIAPEGWPLLEAALATRPKKAIGVEVPLLGKDNSPLLARWRVGLGNVTAFMSDAKPAWARRWMEWPQFERFWAKIFSTAVPGLSPLAAVMDVRVANDECWVLLSVFDEQGRTPLDITPAGVLSVPDEPDRPGIVLQWECLPSGVYQGRAMIEPGVRYLGNLSVHDRTGTVAVRREFAARGRPISETALTGPDHKTLRGLAAAGGGLYKPTAEQLSAVLRSEQSVQITAVKPYWPWLLLLALLLWPLDVACRRMA